VVNEETDGVTLRRQGLGQAPAHPQVTMVVDHAAKHIPDPNT